MLFIYVCTLNWDMKYFFFIFRCPYFQYPCTCKQACSLNNVICLMDKKTRNNCKRCRYVKCEKSAGMKRQWVLQQYIPKVLNFDDPSNKLYDFKTPPIKDTTTASELMKKKTINKLCDDKCKQTEESTFTPELTKNCTIDKVYCVITKYMKNITV